MLQLIRTRRSIRKFTGQAVEDEMIAQIIEAGTWAPSGLNNQPWKVAVIRDQATIKAIAPLTRYSRIIEDAPVLLAPFLDTAASYDRTKDIQAMGAFIQNMLLAIHALGLGGVWLGEILKNKEKVARIVNAPDALELMAIIALGHPAEQGGTGSRKSVKDVVFYRD
jgi:nitroreductase